MKDTILQQLLELEQSEEALSLTVERYRRDHNHLAATFCMAFHRL
jgi:hypothetical protein